MINCNRCAKKSAIDYGGDLAVSENFGVHEQSTRLYSKTGLCRKCGERDSMIARSVINCLYEIMPSLWRVPTTIKDLNTSMSDITRRIDRHLRYIKARLNDKEAEVHSESEPSEVHNEELGESHPTIIHPEDIESNEPHITVAEPGAYVRAVLGESYPPEDIESNDPYVITPEPLANWGIDLPRSESTEPTTTSNSSGE